MDTRRLQRWRWSDLEMQVARSANVLKTIKYRAAFENTTHDRELFFSFVYQSLHWLAKSIVDKRRLWCDTKVTYIIRRLWFLYIWWYHVHGFTIDSASSHYVVADFPYQSAANSKHWPSIELRSDNNLDPWHIAQKSPYEIFRMRERSMCKIVLYTGWVF